MIPQLVHTMRGPEDGTHIWPLVDPEHRLAPSIIGRRPVGVEIGRLPRADLRFLRQPRPMAKSGRYRHRNYVLVWACPGYPGCHSCPPRA